MDYLARSLKAQMREANRLGARYTLILGEDELARGEATLRNMQDSTQESVQLDGLTERLKRIVLTDRHRS